MVAPPQPEYIFNFEGLSPPSGAHFQARGVSLMCALMKNPSRNGIYPGKVAFADKDDHLLGGDWLTFQPTSLEKEG